ncbi:rubrerythrin family protein [bacterium]|nr:rubrerythrin family protein [bacterium]
MSKTLEVLTKAFIGESQARNKYTFYASIAKKEGLIQIADVFTVTANQEKEHASQLFKMIQSLKGDANSIEVGSEVSFTLGDTKENLKAAMDGEAFEKDSMYPEFAKIAEEEGHADIAAKLKCIAVAENHHYERFAKLLKVLEDGSIFRKDKQVVWVCAECGYVYIGEEAPKVCPCCGHPQGYYYLMNEEY